MKDIFNKQIDCQLGKDLTNNPIWILNISAEICGGMSHTFKAYNLEGMYKEVPPKWHWVLDNNFK